MQQSYKVSASCPRHLDRRKLRENQCFITHFRLASGRPLDLRPSAIISPTLPDPTEDKPRRTDYAYSSCFTASALSTSTHRGFDIDKEQPRITGCWTCTQWHCVVTQDTKARGNDDEKQQESHGSASHGCCT